MWGFNPKGKLISAYKLRKTLHLLMPDIQLPEMFDDKQYFIPDNPAYVMRKIRSDRYAPIPDKLNRTELRDCNHFNRIFRGILSQKGWGRLLAMDLGIDTKNPDFKKRYHALIGFLSPDLNQIILGEPQNREIVSYSDYDILRIII